VEQVAREWQSRLQIQAQFAAEGSTFTLAELANRDYSDRDYLVFIDGRLACRSHEPAEGTDWAWVSQPDGVAYLAGRWRSTCDGTEAVPARRLVDASRPVPQPPIAIEELPAEPMGPVTEAIVGSLVYTAMLVLSPIAIGVGLPVLAAGAASGHSTEAKRAQVSLGMTREEAEKLLGKPTVEFPLPYANTVVLGYVVRGMDVSAAGNWYLGVTDDRLAWSHAACPWLDGLGEQAYAAAQRIKAVSGLQDVQDPGNLNPAHLADLTPLSRKGH
jgi:hypothetical protein